MKLALLVDAIRAQYGELNIFLTLPYLPYARQDRLTTIGEGRNISKAPKTDDGTKNSACGLLKVSLDKANNYVLEDQVSFNEEALGELKEVYRDGKLLINQSLKEVRLRVAERL